MGGDVAAAAFRLGVGDVPKVLRVLLSSQHPEMQAKEPPRVQPSKEDMRVRLSRQH